MLRPRQDFQQVDTGWIHEVELFGALMIHQSVDAAGDAPLLILVAGNQLETAGYARIGRKLPGTKRYGQDVEAELRRGSQSEAHGQVVWYRRIRGRYDPVPSDVIDRR